MVLDFIDQLLGVFNSYPHGKLLCLKPDIMFFKHIINIHGGMARGKYEFLPRHFKAIIYHHPFKPVVLDYKVCYPAVEMYLTAIGQDRLPYG